VLTALPELSKLTALDLSHTDINDDDIKTIATKAIHLKKLTLMDCKSLSDIGIGYIADVCHCLEYLVIHNKVNCFEINLQIILFNAIVFPPANAPILKSLK
jgi:hypothetical protein